MPKQPCPYCGKMLSLSNMSKHVKVMHQICRNCTAATNGANLKANTQPVLFLVRPLLHLKDAETQTGIETFELPSNDCLPKMLEAIFMKSIHNCPGCNFHPTDTFHTCVCTDANLLFQYFGGAVLNEFSAFFMKDALLLALIDWCAKSNKK